MARVTKIGNGTLTLRGTNTYTGGTTITQGTLRVGNSAGSATGSGNVQVNGGTLGGIGIIAGETTIGPGTTAIAILEPSAGGKKPATLTIQGALHFKGGWFNITWIQRNRRVMSSWPTEYQSKTTTTLALRR